MALFLTTFSWTWDLRNVCPLQTCCKYKYILKWYCKDDKKVKCFKNQYFIIFPAILVTKFVFVQRLLCVEVPKTFRSQIIGRGLFHQSVEPVVVVYWSSSNNMPAPVTTLAKRQPDNTNLFSGSKLDILNQLVRSLCPTGGWVMASNMHHGKYNIRC